MSYYNPAEIAGIFGDTSYAKAKMPFTKFALMAIMGGIFIALGGLLTVIVAGGMPETAIQNIGLVKFMAGALFPVGLIMVSVAGADLFTSDCAGMVLSTMQRKTVWLDLLKVWILAYIFNFVGAQFVAWFMAHDTHIIASEPFKGYLANLANGKLSHDWYTVFIKGEGS